MTILVALATLASGCSSGSSSEGTDPQRNDPSSPADPAAGDGDASPQDAPSPELALLTELAQPAAPGQGSEGESTLTPVHLDGTPNAEAGPPRTAGRSGWVDDENWRLVLTSGGDGRADEQRELIWVGGELYGRFSAGTGLRPEASDTWLTDPDHLFMDLPPQDLPTNQTGSLLAGIYGILDEQDLQDLATTASLDEGGDVLTIGPSPASAFHGGFVAEVELTIEREPSGSVIGYSYRGLSSADDLGFVRADGTVSFVSAPEPLAAPASSRVLVVEDGDPLRDPLGEPVVVPDLDDLDLDRDELGDLDPGSCIVLDREVTLSVRFAAEVRPCSTDTDYEIVSHVPVEEPSPQRPAAGNLTIFAAELERCRQDVNRYLGDPTGAFRPFEIGYGYIPPDLAAYERGSPQVACVAIPNRPESVRDAWNTGAASSFAWCYDFTRPEDDQFLSCDQPHDAEVFAQVSGGSEPEATSDDEILSTYAAPCFDLLTEFVGADALAIAESGVLADVRPFKSSTWAEDRAVLCQVNTTEMVTGSAFGTGARLGA